MNRRHHPSTSKAFTLVELAIVMAIIGLLIGGILKGMEMLNNARITSTIAQVRAYQAALETFSDKYDALPGDMSNALVRIPGCTVANLCFNGDGNSTVGSVVLNAPDLDQTGVAVPLVETSMFWKHLALADLIVGVSPSANPAAPNSGDTHPIAKIRGIFTASSKTDGASAPNSFPSGVLIKIQGQANVGTSYVLTPSEAVQIDRKMDDGLPNTGFVAGERVMSGCKIGDLPPDTYNELDERHICMLYFRMR